MGLVDEMEKIATVNAVPTTAIDQGKQYFDALESAVAKALSEHKVLILSSLGIATAIIVGGIFYFKHKNKRKK